MDRGVLQDRLMTLERQGWNSLCDGTGAEFYGRMMAEDGLMVLANGVVMDRAAVVESLGQAPPWRTYEISDVHLVGTGSDAAAIVYTASAYGEEDAPAFVGLMSSVYVLIEHEWQLALYQQTPLPADGS